MQEVRFASEMKRRNTRIKELHNQGVKSGNMILYEQETAKLQTSAMLNAGLTHYTKGGVIQFSTSAKAYRSQLGEQAKRIKIRTVTEFRSKAKEHAREQGVQEPETFNEISDYWYLVGMRGASFAAMCSLVDQYVTESEEAEQLPELRGGKGARKSMTFDEFLNKMADVLEDRGIEADQYRPIPFTDFQSQRE